MKRVYPSGAKKREAKRKQEEDAKKCSGILGTWLSLSSTSTSSANTETLEESSEPKPSTSTTQPQLVSERKEPESSQNEQDRNAKDCKTLLPDACIVSVTTETHSLPSTNVKRGDTFPDIITDPSIKYAVISSGPEQPPGPFPRDEQQDQRHFSSNFYYSTAKSGLQLRRNWLCYSTKHDSVYCQPCWLFPEKATSGFQSVWVTGFRDWKHLSERIKLHENSQSHALSCVVYEQWQKHRTLDEALEEEFKKNQSFWYRVLERILDVTLMLATCNLAFRGRSHKLSDSNKGNFLSIIELLAKYDPVLKNLLEMPDGSVKYLCPQIQNELISLLAEQVHNSIISELQKALFFSVIMDTTQDSSKIDQLSEVYRYVKIVSNESGKPTKLEICETFTSFTEVRDQSADGLSNQIISSINQKKLNIHKLLGQGYDGAAVMSGHLGGVQKKISEVAPQALFVHCAAHNLNLVLKDAVRENSEISRFFEIVQEIYNFFGHSIVRWQDLQTSSEEQKISKTTIKTLNPTRFSGTHDSIHALKKRLPDIMNNLSRIALTSKKSSERNEALGLQKRIESLDFVCCLVILCKVFEKINIVSKALQTETTDLIIAHELLENAYIEVSEIRQSFEGFVKEACDLCSKLGIPLKFSEKKVHRKRKKHFDELCVDERLSDPKENFAVSVFYPLVDTICFQLKYRFEGMKSVVDIYKIVQPKFMVNATDEEICLEAEKFQKCFSDHISSTFPSQLLSLRSAFRKKITQIDSVKQLAEMIIIENSSLTSSYSDVCTACIMFLTLPVTVATAERSFSKLKLIKNYLRSSMGQERLSGLALLSIENERARGIDFSKIINEFAARKSRKRRL